MFHIKGIIHLPHCLKLGVRTQYSTPMTRLNHQRNEQTTADRPSLTLPLNLHTPSYHQYNRAMISWRQETIINRRGYRSRRPFYKTDRRTTRTSVCSLIDPYNRKPPRRNLPQQGRITSPATHTYKSFHIVWNSSSQTEPSRTNRSKRISRPSRTETDERRCRETCQ